MKKLFGTDGIRAVAGKFPLDRSSIRILGSGLAALLRDGGSSPRSSSAAIPANPGPGWKKLSSAEFSRRGGSAVSGRNHPHVGRIVPDQGACLCGGDRPFGVAQSLSTTTASRSSPPTGSRSARIGKPSSKTRFDAAEMSPPRKPWRSSRGSRLSRGIRAFPEEPLSRRSRPGRNRRSSWTARTARVRSSLPGCSGNWASTSSPSTIPRTAGTSTGTADRSIREPWPKRSVEDGRRHGRSPMTATRTGRSGWTRTDRILNGDHTLYVQALFMKARRTIAFGESRRHDHEQHGARTGAPDKKAWSSSGPGSATSTSSKR